MSTGQQTISSFFSKSPSKKRKSSPIDLTENDLGDHTVPPKKSKKGEVTSSFFTLDSTSNDARAASASNSKSTGTASRNQTSVEKPNLSPFTRKTSKWRFSEPSSEDVTSHSISALSDHLDMRKGKRKVFEPAASTQTTEHPSFRERILRKGLVQRSQTEYVTNVEEEQVNLSRSEVMPWEKMSKNKKSDRSLAMTGPAGLPCTPLEEEVIKFKKSHPGIVLLIQVGYKFCFFGDDAKIAGDVLGFGYGRTNNFLRTSFPLHNLKANAKKLVAAGHKVGVISQIETAALKRAGDNRNTLFDRKLTQLYTPATFVDDLDSQDDTDNFGQATPPLMCIVEITKGSSLDDKVLFGLVSVVPSTGDTVYDEFEDTLLRVELETRLTHLRPCELLLPDKLSTPTEKVLRHFSALGTHTRPRIERLKQQPNYTEAFTSLSNLYGKQSDRLVAALADLPKHVVVALALVHKHLSAFELSDMLLETKFFTKFTTRTHMVLNSSTLNDLEIYQNQTDGTERGTLFSVMNQTKTMFGKRLLKTWIGRPLVDKIALQERIEAVEEARMGTSMNLVMLRDLLKGLPDIARGLCSIQYGKCTARELATLLTAWSRIGATFPTFGDLSDVGCSSSIWATIIYALPSIHEPMKDLLSSINLHRARNDDKENLWTDDDKFPALAESRLAIMITENDLAEELKKIRKDLKMPSLNYVCVGSNEFLIEVPKERASIVPTDWSRIGSTTKVLRYHSPNIRSLLEERERHKESFQAEVQSAYKAFLREIAQHYALLRDVANKLAIADCLMSLATVSFDENLCKPNFVEPCSLFISKGRHPIIEQLKADPFVPNTVALGGDFPRNLVISGPNMGGKSSVVRMTAVLVILAQIGSYVPAERMDLSIHDTILTRMGASDNLAAGRSTFMVEISETREILQSVTENSLVILDELGRGTSTFDGMAIAGAVLEHLAREVKCKTLFITHYPTLARELEVRYPQDIANVHMSYREDEGIDGQREIHFLYRLEAGISGGSFGIECARLAGVPDPILSKAMESSERMERLLEEKARKANAKNALRLLQCCINARDVHNAPLDEVRTQIQIMGLTS